MTNTTQPVGFIHFHGLTLLVVRYEGVDYVPAKPLSDLTVTDWRSTRRTLELEDNLQLYGTKRVPNLLFVFRDGSFDSSNDSLKGASTSQNAEDFARNSTLCIRLDRAHMYLARINTSQMRVQGNEDGANKLLALQIEWANVLHNYETKGFAAKANRKTALNELFNLMKIRSSATAKEKQWLTTLIEEQALELGVSESELQDAQAALNF